jgi:glycosyltransferase involved in cell wall biosynthesis
MRLLLLTQYFPPETGAAPNRLSDLARRLSSAGHDVTVLTSMPNYPKGRIFEGYRGRFFLEEKAGAIRILRAWAYVGPRRGFLPRLINYLSFAASAVWTGIRHGGAQEAVIVESPPLFLGVSGLLLSRRYSTPMIFNVSDLWPQSAVSMGILRNPILIAMATALERLIYRHSYAITAQTEGIVEEIRKHAAAVPVEFVPNGVDPDRFTRSSSRQDSNRP